MIDEPSPIDQSSPDFKPKPHRTRTQGRIFPILESQAAAAGAMHVSVELVRAAKVDGCPAFISGSRVDMDILVPHCFQMLTKGENRLPSGFASWKEWTESIRGKLLDVRLDKERKAVMDTNDAKRQAGEASGYFFSELERMLREYPPSLAGGDAVHIFKKLSEFVEKLRTEADAKFKAIGA